MKRFLKAKQQSAISKTSSTCLAERKSEALYNNVNYVKANVENGLNYYKRIDESEFKENFNCNENLRSECELFEEIEEKFIDVNTSRNEKNITDTGLRIIYFKGLFSREVVRMLLPLLSTGGGNIHVLKLLENLVNG